MCKIAPKTFGEMLRLRVCGGLPLHCAPSRRAWLCTAVAAAKIPAAPFVVDLPPSRVGVLSPPPAACQCVRAAAALPTRQLACRTSVSRTATHASQQLLCAIVAPCLAFACSAAFDVDVAGSGAYPSLSQTPSTMPMQDVEFVDPVTGSATSFGSGGGSGGGVGGTNPYVRQYELETLALARTVQKYRELCEAVKSVKKGAALGPAQRLLVRWFRPLAECIDEEQRAVWLRRSGMDRFVYGPYLILLPPEKLAGMLQYSASSL
jgi:hypothetical protein